MNTQRGPRKDIAHYGDLSSHAILASTNHSPSLVLFSFFIQRKMGVLYVTIFKYSLRNFSVTTLH